MRATLARTEGLALNIWSTVEGAARLNVLMSTGDSAERGGVSGRGGVTGASRRSWTPSPGRGGIVTRGSGGGSRLGAEVEVVVAGVADVTARASGGRRDASFTGLESCGRGLGTVGAVLVLRGSMRTVGALAVFDESAAVLTGGAASAGGRSLVGAAAGALGTAIEEGTSGAGFEGSLEATLLVLAAA